MNNFKIRSIRKLFDISKLPYFIYTSKFSNKPHAYPYLKDDIKMDDLVNKVSSSTTIFQLFIEKLIFQNKKYT